MMKPSGKYVAWFIPASLVPMALFALVNWRVDPLQHYRKAAYAPDFSLQQRYQNPGLARHYPFDTVIIGSSLTESVSAREVERIFGGMAINLSLAGASAHEMRRVLDLALRRGSVKKAIWCVDIFAFRGDPERVSKDEGEFPAYLYDDRLWNDRRYLLNADVFRSSLAILLSESGLQPRKLLDLDRLHNTYEGPEAYSPEAVTRKWDREQRAFDAGFRRFPLHSFQYEGLCRSFDRNALELMQRYSSVRFLVYFAPVSVIAYKAAVKEQVFEPSLRFKDYVVRALDRLPNVEVYDFQTLEDIVCDLHNYRDILHYRKEVDEDILEAMAGGRNRIRPADLPASEDRLRRLVERFVPPFLPGAGP